MCLPVAMPRIAIPVATAQIAFTLQAHQGNRFDASGKDRYHRINADPHENPAPNAARQIRAWSAMTPFCTASLSAIGIEADVVLP